MARTRLGKPLQGELQFHFRDPCWKVVPKQPRQKPGWLSSIIPYMDIKTQLNESMKDAMRSGDTLRKNTVRMALAAIKQAEVDKQTTLDEMAVIALLQKEIKNRKEAIEEAKTAGRDDLIKDNQAEISVLEVFLPEAMSADELREIVKAAIAETGASVPADMGKVMKVALEKVAGRAPGGEVSAMVREQLTG